MKILAIGDFHGSIPRNLGRTIRENGIELVLCTGDLCSRDRTEWKYWKRLRAGEKLEDIVGSRKIRIILGRSISNSRKAVSDLDKLGIPIVLVYGNGDVTNEYLRRHGIRLNGIEDIVKRSKNIHLVRNGKFVFRDLKILAHSGYRGYTAKKGDENGKFSERKIKANKIWRNEIKKLAKDAKGPFIFLTHDVPLGKLDEVKNSKSPVNGEHVGDETYLEFDRKYKPLLHICGHMHENQGTAKIGRTAVMNPGFGKIGEAAIINYNGKDIDVKLIR